MNGEARLEVFGSEGLELGAFWSGFRWVSGPGPVWHSGLRAPLSGRERLGSQFSENRSPIASVPVPVPSVRRAALHACSGVPACGSSALLSAPG